MTLASYTPSEAGTIESLFRTTFAHAETEEEGQLIGALVAEMMHDTPPEDIFGFTAKDGDTLIGGIFFTRMWFDDPIDVFILSPVAVHPEHQKKGVGQALISFGLEQLKAAGVERVFTYGDPNYYNKVGFEPIDETIAKAPHPLSQPQGWICQSLIDAPLTPLTGTARCVDALNKPEIW